MLESIGEYLLSALKAFYCWLLKQFITLFSASFGMMLDLLPDWLSAQIADALLTVAEWLYGFDDYLDVPFLSLVVGGIGVWKIGYTVGRFVFRLLRG